MRKSGEGKDMEGHDGPYDAPVVIGPRAVPPEWIDYNGHMNVAYYTMAFDQAIDRFLEDELGIGESFVARDRQGPYALQAHIHYMGELLEGDEFSVSILLHDHDAKRMHLVLEMWNSDTGVVSATCEEVLMNVDLETRRSAPYPDWAQARLASMRKGHSFQPRPQQMGRPIGLMKS
jgi:acyl-CoA thioester hydrolase